MSDCICMKNRFRGFLPVVVDVETAGLEPKTDALLEISMMFINMDDKGRFFPQEQLSANIIPFEGSILRQENLDFLKINPYDESRELKTEKEALIPMFKAVAAHIKKEKCKKAILVGHNGSFDLGFLSAAASRLDYKRFPFHPFSVIDTASLSMLVYGQSVLARACTMAKIEFNLGRAHTAAYDTQKECELFCSILNRSSIFLGFPEPYSEQN